jgi:hypothetical protein
MYSCMDCVTVSRYPEISKALSKCNASPHIRIHVWNSESKKKGSFALTHAPKGTPHMEYLVMADDQSGKGEGAAGICDETCTTPMYDGGPYPTARHSDSSQAPHSGAGAKA